MNRLGNRVLPGPRLATIKLAAREEDFRIVQLQGQLLVCATGCLGPCAVSNNALLMLHGRSIWLNDLNRPDLAIAVCDLIETMLVDNHIIPPPDALQDHVYDRFLPPPSDGYEVLATAAESADSLDRLDPVCSMDVDPSPARHTVEYRGRVVGFCAPSCTKQFLADPSAYLTA